MMNRRLAGKNALVLLCLALIASPKALATTSTLTTPDTSSALTLQEPEWRERVRKASLSEDYRETLACRAVDRHELEQTTSARIQGRHRRHEVAARFVSTSETLAGPVGFRPRGSLTGRIIFCSAGHGWTNETTTGLWYTQRPLTFGVVEEFGNLDQLNLFADLCFRAGATVVPMRPLGYQPIERIVDNTSGNARFQGPWHDSTSTLYYGSLRDRIPYRFAIASKEETAAARYQPYLPKADYYPVYGWARDGADRVNQTYRIVHSGGATEITVNHRRVGKGWVYLGEYYFDEGFDGYVEITNRVTDPYEADGSHVVIADAIRFGNGMGDINRGAGISGAPREEEASRYWVEASIAKAAPAIYEITDTGDQANNVGTPPRMAAHMNRESEGSYFDRLYLGYHSNAVGGRGAVGLFEDTPELRPDYQVEWAEMIAQQFNEDLTTTGFVELPVAWFVRKKLTDSHIDFGEIRRDYLNNEMVATIIEVAFHDNPVDAYLLRSPQSRLAMALSSYKAALKYFQRFDPVHAAATLLPATPVLLSARSADTSTVVVTWSPAQVCPARAAAAGSYRVYHSPNGYGFDGGIEVKGATSCQFQGLAMNEPHYFRVSAVNGGGESAPSRTLAAARLTSAPAEVLLISAFSTLNEDLNLTQTAEANLGAPLRPGGEFVRIIPRLMNPGTQAVEGGKAIADAGYGFDSCTLESLTSQSAVSLNAYRSIVLQFGRQSHRDGLLHSEIPPIFVNYLAQGGNLFVSGAQIGRAEETTGSQPALSLARLLHLRYKGELSPTPPQVHGEAGTLLSTAALSLVITPDRTFQPAPVAELEAAEAGKPLLNYAAKPGSVAAVAYSGAGNHGRVVSFGFPFEQIQGYESRREIMRQILDWFHGERKGERR